MLVEITPQAPVKIPKDDLTNIEGIGPAIAKVLKKAGILNTLNWPKLLFPNKNYGQWRPRFLQPDQRQNRPIFWPKASSRGIQGAYRPFERW
ncbi:MAG: hypothetical protein U0T81_10440 [Saprospiraceae bacterium]